MGTAVSNLAWIPVSNPDPAAWQKLNLVLSICPHPPFSRMQPELQGLCPALSPAYS